jgi:hypothetical protein
MSRSALPVALLLALPVFGQQDPLEIVRRSVERDQDSFANAKDYTYLERVRRQQLDSGGHVKDTDTKTFDVTMIEGEPYRRQIEKDDKPLPPNERRKSEEKFEKELRQRQSESASQRAKREAEAEKERREGREFLKEVPQAFSFRLDGEQHVDGHEVWVIHAEPRPDFQPHVKYAGMLKKFRGTLWIDKASYDWVRVEVEAIDTVSYGLLLARVAKGTHFEFSQQRINDQVWLPERIHIRMDARLGLVKRLNEDVDVSFKNYRKFQTDSRIVSTATPQ